MTTDREQLEAQLQLERRRLHECELQLAQAGTLAPPDVKIAAEDLRRTVAALEAQLAPPTPAALIAHVAEAYRTPDEFARRAAAGAQQLDPAQISGLASWFHNPPANPNASANQFAGYAAWMAACQAAIFELAYHHPNAGMQLLYNAAFGRYDWTQARAIDILCRHALAGRSTDHIARDLANALPRWRYETVSRALPSLAQLAARSAPLADALRAHTAALRADQDPTSAFDSLWALVATAPDVARIEEPWLRELLTDASAAVRWWDFDLDDLLNDDDEGDAPVAPIPEHMRFVPQPDELAVRAAFALLHLFPQDEQARAALIFWRTHHTDPATRAEIAAALEAFRQAQGIEFMTTTPPAARPWVPPAVDAFARTHAARYADLAPHTLASTVEALVATQARHVDQDCINLYAGTNAINPRASRLLGSSIGSRPSLGYPGAKYNKGVADAEQIEIALNTAMRRLLNANYVETRVPSGSLANLYAYMATTKPGDAIMAFNDAAAGHPTHHAIGAAGLYGLQVHDVPFDTQRMDVDVPALAEAAAHIRPKLIIVAGSMCLFPYDVKGVRQVADAVGAYVLYDAAHMGGLIAGGRFQQPLAEGAHVMTGSTYKSFGGPPAGFVATNEPALAERLDAIAYPGLTANFDVARSAALAVAVADLLAHGPEYADMMINNAQALAAALADAGVAVFRPEKRTDYTVSQHVALIAEPYDGGDAACQQLERANIIATGIGIPTPNPPTGTSRNEGSTTATVDFTGIRLGTQEITRWGMQPADMPRIAALIARVLVHHEPPETVRPDVIALRGQFRELRYVV